MAFVRAAADGRTTPGNIGGRVAVAGIAGIGGVTGSWAGISGVKKIAAPIIDKTRLPGDVVFVR
jgi:hypothetical protein